METKIESPVPTYTTDIIAERMNLPTSQMWTRSRLEDEKDKLGISLDVGFNYILQSIRSQAREITGGEEKGKYVYSPLSLAIIYCVNFLHKNEYSKMAQAIRIAKDELLNSDFDYREYIDKKENKTKEFFENEEGPSEESLDINYNTSVEEIANKLDLHLDKTEYEMLTCGELSEEIESLPFDLDVGIEHAVGTIRRYAGFLVEEFDGDDDAYDKFGYSPLAVVVIWRAHYLYQSKVNRSFIGVAEQASSELKSHFDKKDNNQKEQNNSKVRTETEGKKKMSINRGDTKDTNSENERVFKRDSVKEGADNDDNDQGKIGNIVGNVKSKLSFFSSKDKKSDDKGNKEENKDDSKIMNIEKSSIITKRKKNKDISKQDNRLYDDTDSLAEDRDKINEAREKFDIKLDPDLVLHTLTHPSATNGIKIINGTKQDNYAFAGNFFLRSFIATKSVQEGLNRQEIQSELQDWNKARLGLVGRNISLDNYVIVGNGTMSDSDAILSQTIKAIIGALKIHKGSHPCEDWMEKFLSRRR